MTGQPCKLLKAPLELNYSLRNSLRFLKVWEKGVIPEPEGMWVAGQEEVGRGYYIVLLGQGPPPGQGHVCPGVN